jgi:ferrous iron transport protein A
MRLFFDEKQEPAANLAPLRQGIQTANDRYKILLMMDVRADKQTVSGRVRLSEMKPGDEAVISAFDESGNGFQRLQDMGLLTGTIIRLIRFAPLGDPIEIKARGYYLSLRKSAADKIWVIKK